MVVPFEAFDDEKRSTLLAAGFPLHTILDLAAGVKEARNWAKRYRRARSLILRQQAETHLHFRQAVEGWPSSERAVVELGLLPLIREAPTHESPDGIRRVDLLAMVKPIARSLASPSAAKRQRKGDRRPLRWLTMLVLDLAEVAELGLGKLVRLEAVHSRIGRSLAPGEARSLETARLRARSRAAPGLWVARSAYGAPFLDPYASPSDKPDLADARNEVGRALECRRKWAHELAPTGSPEAWDRATGAGAGLAHLRALRPRPGVRTYWPPECEPTDRIF
jgi:hypothetical protein